MEVHGKFKVDMHIGYSKIDGFGKKQMLVIWPLHKWNRYMLAWYSHALMNQL